MQKKYNTIIFSSLPIFDQNIFDKLEDNDPYIYLNKIYNFNYSSRLDFRNLNKNEFEVLEIFPNSENNLNMILNHLNLKIKDENLYSKVFKIIKNIKPSLIIIRNYEVINLDYFFNFKYETKMNFLTVLLCGFPIRYERFYSNFDKVIFRSPYLIKKYYNHCKSSNLIYHCFNSNALKKIRLKSFEEKKIITSFQGSSYGQNFLAHKKRYVYLFNLLEKKLLTASIYEKPSNYDNLVFILYSLHKLFGKKFDIIFSNLLKIIISTNKKIFKKFYKRFEILQFYLENFENKQDFNFYAGPLKKIFKEIKNEKFGNEYLEEINNSKISINIHTDAMENTAANIRLFEIPGMGSCQITEDCENLKELFIPEKEVITYSNLNDLEEKIIFLKKNYKKAEEIAAAGYQKVITKHTEINRIKEFNDELKF